MLFPQNLDLLMQLFNRLFLLHGLCDRGIDQADNRSGKSRAKSPGPASKHPFHNHWMEG
jgi:hypothetical protein